MIKKFIIVSVVVLGVGMLVAGPGMFNHMGHMFHKARSGIQGALPLEYEIEREMLAHDSSVDFAASGTSPG